MVKKNSEVEYRIIHQDLFTEIERNILAEFLIKQGRVLGDSYQKLDRCKWLCFAIVGGKKIAVGAIKQKTPIDFELAELPELSKSFEWELGYFFTEKGFEGQGIAKEIASKLISTFGDGNLMASTEFEANPAMDKILTSNGFVRRGESWVSRTTGNNLGLYLKLNE